MLSSFDAARCCSCLAKITPNLQIASLASGCSYYHPDEETPDWMEIQILICIPVESLPCPEIDRTFKSLCWLLGVSADVR